MVQQMQSVCSECKGEGEIIPHKDRCTTCQGKKLVSSDGILEVHIDKGAFFCFSVHLKQLSYIEFVKRSF